MPKIEPPHTVPHVEIGEDEQMLALTEVSEFIKTLNYNTSYSDKSMWKEVPVDFVTFCKEWIREPLFEGPQEKWAREFIGEPTEESLWYIDLKIALLFLGKGSGKGSMSAKLLTYAGYLLKLMRDPRAFFGIGRTAPIHMINVSYNSFQAKQVFFQGYLIPTVRNCLNPKTGKNFFAERGMDLREDKGDILSNMIHFERPKKEDEGGITAVSLAGDRGTAEGFSPLLIFVDEYSAMSNPVKAEKLVDDLEKSAQSRFVDHYKVVIASFKQGKNCLMSLKYEEAIEKKLPDVYCLRAATWEVNKLKQKESFQKFYNTNPVKAARSYECVEVPGFDDTVFFKLVDRLHAVVLDEEHNPFEGNVITCRSDQLDVLKFKSWFKPKIRANYNIHVDLARGKGSDRAGLVMSHKEGLESLTQDQLDKFISGDMENIRFKVKVDLILQITASKERGEIILDEIRQFIKMLFKCGFKLNIVTLDGFQSLDFIQQLNGQGIKAEMLSVDRDRKAYDSLLSIIYRQNLEMYEHSILLRELEELEESEDGKKIDHPVKSLRRAKFEDQVDSGSKDLSDALAGSVLKSILASAPSLPLMPSLGKTHHPADAEMIDIDNFEKQITGGLIPVDKYGVPIKEGDWVPLLDPGFGNRRN